MQKSTVTLRTPPRVMQLLLIVAVIAPLSALGLAPAEKSAPTISRIFRLNGGQPIISRVHFEQAGATKHEGENINGPSVIRIPDWIPAHKRANPRASYYMYFAHHNGRYIRLAWAEDVEGPWSLYGTGAGIEKGERGVIDIGEDRRLQLDPTGEIVGHIASPDVHVDSEKQQIIMYLHGKNSLRGAASDKQQSFAATSPWGLDFNSGVGYPPLSRAYLRVFEHQGTLQGLTRNRHFEPRSQQTPLAAPSGFDPRKESLWDSSRTPALNFSDYSYHNNKDLKPKKTRLRHLALQKIEGTLLVFFTMKGHAPERIFMATADLNQDCWYCKQSSHAPVEVLRPETVWEGNQLPLIPSKDGIEKHLANALRDPYMFKDEGKYYLFYAGGGESAIGLAQVEFELP